MTVLYGSIVADGTIATASDMAAATGGTETSQLITFSGGSGFYGEVYSRTGTSPLNAAIPGTPTGHGWVYSPGAGTFALGNWSAAFSIAAGAGGNPADLTLRFFKYSGGSYTSIGTILNSSPGISTTRSVCTFAATSMAATTFAAGDLVYVDLWWHDPTGIGGENPTIWASTSATQGIANDVQITTSSFTATVAPTGQPRYIRRALGATIIPVIVSQPLPYIDRGLQSTIIYEQRTFVPHALGGVYIPDDPALLWVPRAFGSTTQIPSTIALARTLAGVGTLSETLSLATSLTVTLPGVGTLVPTLSANTALTVTLPGVGTLAGTLSLATALSTTLAGVGTLNETFTLATALTDTMAGVGTLTGTMAANTALSTTGTGVGTLSGSLFAVSQPLPYIGRGLFATIVYETRTFVPRAIAGVYIPDTILPVPRALLSTIMAGVGLSGTMAGVGTLAGTFSLSTALSVTMAGVGTLTPGLSTTGGVSLAVTMAGVGTLSGSLSLSTALTTTCAGVGTLSGTMSANTALATTVIGVGTLSGTLAFSTALGSSLVGVGTLSGVFTIRVALFLTCAGMGSLAGTLSIPSLSFLTAIWVTRDLTATWTARAGMARWTTRDEHATWGSRDESAAWTTRDEQASWKTRG